MRRFVTLLLAGCAAVNDPRAGGIELVPDRPYQVIMAGPRVFTFTLEAPTQVVLESQVFPGDVLRVSPVGRLLDAEGRVVASDRHGGGHDGFRIAERLAAGTWFLRVDTPHACFSTFECLHRDYRYEVLLRVEEAP